MPKQFLEGLIPPSAGAQIGRAAEHLVPALRAGAANVLDLGGLPFALKGVYDTFTDPLETRTDEVEGFLPTLKAGLGALADPRPGSSQERNMGIAQAIGERADQVVGELTGMPDFSRMDIEDSQQTAGMMFSAFAGMPNVFGRVGDFLDGLKAAGKPTAAAVTAVKGAARVAEVLTPLSVPFTPGVVAANAAVGGLLDVGIRELANASVLENPEQAVMHTAETLTSGENIRFDAGGPVTVASEEATQQILKHLMLDPKFREQMQQLPQEQQDMIKTVVDPYRIPKDKVSLAEKAAIGAAAVAGTAYFLRRRLAPSAHGRGSTVSIGDNPTSEFPIEQPGLLSQLGRQFDPDSEGPLIRQMQESAERITGEKSKLFGESAPRTVADQFFNRLRAKTRFGGNASIHSTLRTGKFSEHPDLNIPSIVEMEEGFAALQPVQQDILSKGLLSADEMDNRTIARKRGLANAVPPQGTARTVDPTTGHVTPATPSDAELMANIQAMDADPQLVLMRSQFRTVANTMTTYLEREGIITSQQAAKWRNQRSNFMPRRRAEDIPQTITQRMSATLENLTRQDRVESRAIRQAEEAIESMRNLGAGQGAQNVLNPLEAMESYVTNLMIYANRNSVQRDFIDYVARDPNVSSIMRKLDPSNKRHKKHIGGEHSVTIRRGGEVEHYQFANPFIAKAFQMNPIAVIPVINSSRRLMQAGTTGIANPAFAVGKSFWWDSFFTASMKPKGRTFGPIDAAVNFVSNGRANIADPLAFFQAMSGVGADAWAQAMDSMSLGIMRELQDQSPFLKQVARSPAGAAVGVGKAIGGEQWLRGIADAMRNQYFNSTRAMLQDLGGYNTGFMMEPTQAMSSLVSNTTGAFTARDLPWLSSVYRMYHGMIESIHNGARTAYFAQNYSPNMTRDELKKLANEVRDLGGGDFSRSGDGTAYRILTQTMPYSNVTIQATRSMARAALRHPKEVGLGLLTTTVLPAVMGTVYISQLGPEWRDWWFNQEAAHKRATHIPFPYPGAEKPFDEDGNLNALLIPMMPEGAAFAQVAVAAVTHAFGLDQDRIAGSEADDMKEALAQVLGLAPPPILRGLAAMGGKRFESQNIFIPEKNVFSNLPTTRTEGGMTEDNAFIDTGMTAQTLELLTSILGTAARMGAIGWSAGEQVLEQSDKDIFDAIGQGMSSIVDQQTSRIPAKILPIPPFFVEPGHRIVGGSDMAQEYFEKETAIERLVKQAQVEESFVVGGAGSTQLTDPDLRLPAVAGSSEDARILAEIRLAWSQNNAISRLNSERTGIMKAKEMLRSNLAPEGENARNRLRLKMNALNSLQQQIERTLLNEIRWIEQNHLGGMTVEEYARKVEAEKARPNMQALPPYQP